MDKTEIQIRFENNLDRVRNLVDIYQNKLTTTGQGRRPVGSTDVLRAAVVLLHATMEDILRSISAGLLPTQGPEVLNKIPLAGTGTHGRAEKFLLGELTAFRGTSVDDVFVQSVEGFLERSNYNKPKELAAAIEAAGLSTAGIQSMLGTLEDMMKRRHWIVHRADHNPNTGSGQHKAKSIGKGKLNEWIVAVEGFGQDLLSQLP
jgi:hypothetical protein